MYARKFNDKYAFDKGVTRWYRDSEQSRVSFGWYLGYALPSLLEIQVYTFQRHNERTYNVRGEKKTRVRSSQCVANLTRNSENRCFFLVFALLSVSWYFSVFNLATMSEFLYRDLALISTNKETRNRDVNIKLERETSHTKNLDSFTVCSNFKKSSDDIE